MSNDELDAFSIHFGYLVPQVPEFYEANRRADHGGFKEYVQQDYPSLYEEDSLLFDDVIEKLRSVAVFRSIGHKYADKVEIFDKARFNSIGFDDAFSRLCRRVREATDQEIYDDWLRKSLYNSVNELSVAEDVGADLGQISAAVDHEWKPLVLDRSDKNLASAIEASESALSTIESDNGYSASEPNERDAIVHSARGTLEALKSGTPSRAQVISGLVQPFKYLAKKFADTSIGVAAKLAVEALVKWLL